MLGLLVLVEKTLDEIILELASDMTAELHPDLVWYLEDGAMGKQLLHPLVYQVPLLTNGHANAQYKWKTAQLLTSIEEENWDRYVFTYERPYRLQGFQQIMHRLSDAQYWMLFGEVWMDTENQWQNKLAMKRLLNSKRPNRHTMMSQDDTNFLADLPDTVTIYRGCRKNLNENGMSWTLDKDKANFFANRLHHGDGKILEETIDKKEIYAVLLGRGESEVIWYKKKTTRNEMK